MRLTVASQPSSLGDAEAGPALAEQALHLLLLAQGSRPGRAMGTGRAVAQTGFRLITSPHLAAALADDQHIAAENATDDKALTLNGDNFVFFVEDCHSYDRWELKVFGPNLFERSYTLEGSAGEHRPEAIRAVLRQILPKHSA